MNMTSPTQGNGVTKVSGPQRLFPRGYVWPFALVISLFFLWGMSNNLTDILVQQFKKAFELSPLEAQLVQTAVFVGYFTVAMPVAILMRRRGYKVGMLLGLALFGGGMLMFWPAALVNRYSVMLVALYLVGCGSATLETAANPFVAEAGPAETSERRLNLAQAFNPAGSITGILTGTLFIFSGVELPAAKIASMKAAGTYAGYLHGELMRVVPVYVALGSIVLLLAILFAVARLPPSDEVSAGELPVHAGTELLSLLRLPQMRSAILAQFCYCGAQIGTWSAFIPYVKQYTHLTERQAGLLLTANLIALTVGRFASTALMRWFEPLRMMRLYALLNAALVVIAVALPGPIGVAALVATSFFMSIMYPTIFASGIRGLGTRTKLAGSLLVMSVIGGAIVPPLLGWLARQTTSYASGYAVIAACYAVVVLFTFRRRALHPFATNERTSF
jgi:FHS family L-fucose permease-like MFS transporter